MDRQRDNAPLTGADEPLERLEPEDPYEGVDTERLPEWWTEAIQEFREHDLRPYKPPRFADDVIVPPVVERLESAYDVDVRFMGVDVQYGDSWGIYVDGDVVSTVARERTADGYTRYEITSDEFGGRIRDHVGEETGGPTVSRSRLRTYATEESRE